MGKSSTAPADFPQQESRCGRQKFLLRACDESLGAGHLYTRCRSLRSRPRRTPEWSKFNNRREGKQLCWEPGTTRSYGLSYPWQASLGSEREECRFSGPAFTDTSIGRTGNTKVQDHLHDDRGCAAACVNSRCPPP